MSSSVSAYLSPPEEGETYRDVRRSRSGALRFENAYQNTPPPWARSLGPQSTASAAMQPAQAFQEP
jgi:hypothetical protein